MQYKTDLLCILYPFFSIYYCPTVLVISISLSLTQSIPTDRRYYRSSDIITDSRASLLRHPAITLNNLRRSVV